MFDDKYSDTVVEHVIYQTKLIEQKKFYQLVYPPKSSFGLKLFIGPKNPFAQKRLFQPISSFRPKISLRLINSYL